MNHGALQSLTRACRIQPSILSLAADELLYDEGGLFRLGTCDLVYFHAEYIDGYIPFTVQVNVFRSLRGYKRSDGPFYVVTESRSDCTFCEFYTGEHNGVSVEQTVRELLSRAWVSTSVCDVACYVKMLKSRIVENLF